MRYIDQNELFAATNQGLSVFESYFPSENLRNPKHYFKERDGEKTASARVYWFNGLYLLTDYGNQDELNGVNAVKYVMHREGLQYIDALRYIEEVVVGRKVSSAGFYRPQYRPDYKVRDMKPEDKKGEYKFVFKEKASEKDLDSIGRYVTQEHLEMYHGKAVERYDYCGFGKKQNKDVVHTFIATDDYPMFVFDYPTFKKLYKPYDTEKKNRFLYIGDKPKDFIYGLEQIQGADNEFIEEDKDGKEEITLPKDKPNAVVKDLFRCSGESDALNLFSIGCRPYWLNSESADYLPGQYKEVDDLCEHHYQIMDLDATGRKHAIKQGLKHMNLATLELPVWISYKKDFRGNPCKDLKDFINISGDDQESTYWNLMAQKRKAKTAKFWVKSEDKNGKTSYNLSLEHLYWFLSLSGFYRIESIYHKKAGYSYAHITGKIVRLINPDHIKRIIKHHVKEYVKSKNVMDEIAILNKINSSAQISEANLQDLPETVLEFKNYSSTTEVLNFKNLSLQITAGEIKKVKHDTLPNYILGELKLEKQEVSDLIDHTFQLNKDPLIIVEPSPKFKILLDKLVAAKTDIARDNANALISQFPELDKYKLTIRDKDFIFIKFLQDLSRLHWRKELEHKLPLDKKEEAEQHQAFINLLYILGYHCSQFKHKAKPWISFLQDMRISEIGQSSGRSGKSLIFTAVEYVRNTFTVEGRALDDKQEFKFIYDGLTEFHDFINVDDFAERGLFDVFYSQATGKRNINQKNLSAFALPYEDSGKMGITSNFELPNQNSSTVARLLNGGVSDFYHEKAKTNDYHETRTPMTRFGRRLYDDFNSHEWNQFYNVIAYAIQLYLRFDKIQPPMENLERRQARREMASGLGREEEFLHWANHYFDTCKQGEVPEYSPEETGYFNTYAIRENAFLNFQQVLSDSQKRSYKANKFKTHMAAFCDYYGYTFNPPELCVGGETESARRIMRSIDGKTRECFFISTAPKVTAAVPTSETPPAPQNNEHENAISNSNEEGDMPF